MKYVLFLCHRLGFEALQILMNKVEISLVVIEKEHDHEIEQYWEKISSHIMDCDLPVLVNPKASEIEKYCMRISFDYLISFGYRKMIPEAIRKLAKSDCIGTHFAPLPQYRGFSPLNWVLINGESKTAINFFILEDDVDAGDIIFHEDIFISDSDTIITLYEKCINSFKKSLLKVVEQLEHGTHSRTMQDSSLATYCCARNPEDGLIDWSQKTRIIQNLIRATTLPFPCAYTFYGQEKVLIVSSEIQPNRPYVGRIFGKVVKIIKNHGVEVLTGDGILLIKECTLEGMESRVTTADKVIQSVRATLRAYPN